MAASRCPMIRWMDVAYSPCGAVPSPVPARQTSSASRPFAFTTRELRGNLSSPAAAQASTSASVTPR